VIGTPCQIDSFRRYIKRYKIEDNFILADLFCHGVISMNIWKKYFEKVKQKVGKPNQVTWRNKYSLVTDGSELRTTEVDWHQSYNIIVKGDKGIYQKKLADGDKFYRFFISEKCLGRACYDHCKYRYDRSAADIRVGDLWGQTFQDNPLGVNAVVVFTEKGEKLLRESNCELSPLPFEIVAEGQMKTPPSIKLRSSKIIKSSTNEDVSIDDLTDVIIKEKKKEFYWHCVTHPIGAIRLIIKKIKKNIKQ
jgi:coenzyme F420-reducing hydrogenase beta subunit